MNKKTLALAEDALLALMNKNIQEYNTYRGKIIRSSKIPKPKQHILSTAIKK